MWEIKERNTKKKRDSMFESLTIYVNFLFMK